MSSIWLIATISAGTTRATTIRSLARPTSAHRARAAPHILTDVIFYHGFGDVLKAYTISNGTITPAPVATGAFSYSFPGATPAISSYGDSANGIVWEVQYQLHRTQRVAGVRRCAQRIVFDDLYSSASGSIGAGVQNSPCPLLLTGTCMSAVRVNSRCLACSRTRSMAPAAPTELSAMAETLPSLQIELNWTDTANNENAFKIERSDNGGAVRSDRRRECQCDDLHRYHRRFRDTRTPIVCGQPTRSVTLTTPIPPTRRSSPRRPFITTTSTMVTAHSLADSAGTNTGVLVGATKPQWVAGRIGSERTFV